jgi:hypothetical protein
MRMRNVSRRWLLVGLAAVTVPIAAGRLHAREKNTQNAAPTAQDTVEARGHHDHHHGAMAAHMKWTTLREETPEDRARADALVATLRRSIEKYKDYRVALDEGYKPFHPELPLEEYHFTNYWYGFKAAFGFDPQKPTSLLYKRTSTGWELAGAMYTAPRRFTEEQLDERVPLSVARWHEHVNLCLPKAHPYTADWTKFGPAGSISTREACEEARGKFVPQIFGWMVHVYPFESDPEKVWAK